MPQIHSSAVVSTKAQIDNDVEIGPFCYIEDDVVIESGTRIFNHVTVYSGARIGKNNQIFPGTVIAAIPQDLKFGGEYSQLILGDNNTIRESVTLNRGTGSGGKTIIGDNNLFMAYSHAAHDCTIGNNCIFANSVALGGHVTLEDYVILGGLTGIHQFVNLGAHTMIGACSMVVKDVIPYALFSGDPLQYKGMNIIGLRRRGFSEAQLAVLKKSYQLIFSSGLNVTQAVEKIKAELEMTEHVMHLLSFISSSSRGIAK